MVLLDIGFCLQPCRIHEFSNSASLYCEILVIHRSLRGVTYVCISKSCFDIIVSKYCLNHSDVSSVSDHQCSRCMSAKDMKPSRTEHFGTPLDVSEYLKQASSIPFAIVVCIEKILLPIYDLGWSHTQVPTKCLSIED